MTKLARWQRKYARNRNGTRITFGELVPAKQEVRQFDISSMNISFKYQLRSNPLLTKGEYKKEQKLRRKPRPRVSTISDWYYKIGERHSEPIKSNTLMAVGNPITLDVQSLRMTSLSDLMRDR